MLKFNGPFLLAVLILLISFASTAYAQETKRISILPFEVHAKDSGVAIRETLNNNLYQELKKEKSIDVVAADDFIRSNIKFDKNKAIEAGKSLRVHYVVFGTLMQLGETISIDAQVADVLQEMVLPLVSVQGKGVESMALIASQLKTEILNRTGLVQKIVRVEIKGTRKIETSAVLEQIKSKPGRNFREADITTDIKTIFKMGFFQDVSAAAESVPEGKVIVFTVQEKGLISEIRITGNKAVSKDDIMEVLTIKTRQSLNQEKIKADVEKIKALYDSKAYYNAEITDKVEKEGEKDFLIILAIKENDKLYVSSITFEGNEAYTSKELLNMMSTTEGGWFSFITDKGLLKRDQLKQDLNKLMAFYANNGFINSQIAEPEITHDAKGIYVKIRIKEGKRFKVGKVEISGDMLEKPRADLLAALRIKMDGYYDREAIMKDMDSLTQATNDEGYADAEVNPKITTREKEQSLDVDFQITKGALVYINRIGISGNTITRDKVIRRQLGIAEGDLYSSTKLKNSYSNLNRLRYFEEVDFQTEKGADKNKRDINIRVKEKNTGMFMVGAGYSAVDQAVIMGQIVQQNFLGYGQIVSLKASLGSTTNNYELSFTEPYLFDMPLWCKFDIWKYKKEYDSYTLDTRGTGVTLGYPLWGKVVGYIGYKLSFDNIQDVNPITATQYIKDQAGERTTSSVTVTLVRDTTDDNIFPTKGTKSSISVQHAGTPLGGNTNFSKFGAGIAGYQSLFWDIVFGAKGRIGYLQNNDGNDYSLPIYERYVLGGINSLRGLRYIGPTLPGTSDVIGGTTMLNFNFELVFPLIKEAGMKGVIFYDTGNSWNGGYYLDDMCQTAGVGIRWFSPIGPLRIEYGYVIRNHPASFDDSKGRWEFTIGMFQ